MDEPTIPEENHEYLTIDSPSGARVQAERNNAAVALRNAKCRVVSGHHMGEANKYYVAVAVDRCIIPGGIMIRAASKESAAQRAEMKVALRMPDAITVTAVNVREG